MMRISGAGATHVGLVRGDNEDSGFVGPTCVLVADGVGGGAAGEVASATAAYVVSATMLARPKDDPQAVLRDAVLRAQEQLVLGVEASPDRAGMATTLTAVVTDGSRFALVHLGDSRAYVWRAEEGLTRVTRDHTWVQGLVDEGRLDERDVRSHPWRNVVLRSLSAHVGEPADVVPLPLRVGDRLLLASDGLTDLVSESWIEEILSRHDDDAALQALIAAALGCGGKDNVTCVVATVVEGPSVSADGVLLGAVRDPANVVDAAAVRRVRSA